MSDLDKLTFTDSVRYSKEHTWARVDGDTVILGISDFAQDELGEIVFIEFPEVATSYGAEEVFGFIESIKAASDLHMPIGGEVVEVNESLEDSPEIVNSDPFGEGWILKIKANDVGEIDTLLDGQAYKENLD
jgi:glycine cleavage system H protein